MSVFPKFLQPWSNTMTRLKQLRSGQVWVFQLSSALSSFLLTKMYRYTFLPLSVFYYFSFFSALFLVSFFTEKITWVLITGSSLFPPYGSFCNKTRRSSSKVLQSRKQVLNLVCNLPSLKTERNCLLFREERKVRVYDPSFFSHSSILFHQFFFHFFLIYFTHLWWFVSCHTLAKKTMSERIKKSL